MLFVNRYLNSITTSFYNPRLGSNVQGMYSACRELLCRTVYFIKKTEQSESTLRHSAVRHSIFCGSLFKALHLSLMSYNIKIKLGNFLIGCNDSMRFLLYNIRYAAGIGRHFHFPVPYSGYFKNTNGNMKKIMDFIGSVNPDIIGLIEVDGGSFRSKKNNQAEAIAWELQHDHVYQSKYPTTSVAQKLPLLKKQGNAILTNQEIISQKFHYFREGVKRLVASTGGSGRCQYTCNS